MQWPNFQINNCRKILNIYALLEVLHEDINQEIRCV